MSKGRLMGVLAVARSFGDIEYKNQKATWEREFTEDPLICTPDVLTKKIADNDEFIIIACDGIWDVMNSQYAVSFVRKELHEHSNLGTAAMALVQCALDRSSVDNCTCVLVALNQTAH